MMWKCRQKKQSTLKCGMWWSIIQRLSDPVWLSWPLETMLKTTAAAVNPSKTRVRRAHGPEGNLGSYIDQRFSRWPRYRGKTYIQLNNPKKKDAHILASAASLSPTKLSCEQERHLLRIWQCVQYVQYAHMHMYLCMCIYMTNLPTRSWRERRMSHVCIHVFHGTLTGGNVYN